MGWAKYYEDDIEIITERLWTNQDMIHGTDEPLPRTDKPQIRIGSKMLVQYRPITKMKVFGRSNV